MFFTYEWFVDFQDKTFLIAQKRRYLNAFLTYITYGGWCQSDDVLLAGYTFGASPQGSASHSPTCLPARLRFLDEWKVSALGSFVYTLALRYPHKKKSQTDRSGERGGQETSPKREIICWGNMHRTTSIDALAVWAVAPSCWNHICLVFTRRLRSSGCRKLFNMT